MRTEEHYGPVTLSIIDYSVSKKLKKFAITFGKILRDLNRDYEVTLYSKAGPYIYEIALMIDGELVRPDSIGLFEFVDLFEDSNSPVSDYISIDELNAIRSKLTELFGV